MASPIVNTSILVNGNIRVYSDFGDTVTLSNNSPANLQTRMMGGADIVRLSDANLGGFSNKVNGNKGGDQIGSLAGSLTRDFVRGGSEADSLDNSRSGNGQDWQNGNFGRDTIIGATSNNKSVLRGGADDDLIVINANSTHIAVGDLGKDEIRNFGTVRAVFRTDGNNAAQNIGDTDMIIGFLATDTAYLPGINSIADLTLTKVGANTYLSSNTFTNGTTGTRFIARFEDRTEAQVTGFLQGGSIIIGARADAALAALTVDNFLNNPDLGGLFG